MTLNTKGGKGHKKKKNSNLGREPVFIDRQVDQIPARALRLLGNRNVLCYSNDNVIRMCHICGKMKGRVFIEPGDMVLITLRDFSENTDIKKVKLGDIIAKYDTIQYSQLKKEEGVNPKLFMKLETMNGCRLAEIGEDMTKTEIIMPEDDGFEFEHSEEEGGIVEKQEVKEVKEVKEVDDDLNIDDI
jgi:translation initiation factor 1A